jgi:hypothetical protein
MSPVADGMDLDGLDDYGSVAWCQAAQAEVLAEDPLTADETGEWEVEDTESFDPDELDEPCDCAYQLPCYEHPEEASPYREYSEAIYGGEGHGSANARQLVVIQPLADRSALSHKERIVVLDSDVREAMQKARARLQAEAMKYANQGFTWDLDDAVFDHGGRRIISATLRIARGDA